MGTISINIVSSRIVEIPVKSFYRSFFLKTKKDICIFLTEYFVPFLFAYFTVTDFARFRGLSGFNHFFTAV